VIAARGEEEAGGVVLAPSGPNQTRSKDSEYSEEPNEAFVLCQVSVDLKIKRQLVEQVGLDCPLPNKLGKIKAMPLQ